MARAAGALNDGRVRRPGHARQAAIIGVCCLTVFMIAIDTTVVNVALPLIGRGLHAPVAGLQWTIAAYTVTTASLMLTSGAIGDRFGRRAVLEAGLAVFTLASAGCSVAPGVGWLIACRALQGAGGSALTPMAMGVITATLSDPAARARAMGIWSGTFGVGMAIGPVLGGVLADALGWRSLFWVNIPVGVIAMVLAGLIIPASQAGLRLIPLAAATAVAGPVAGRVMARRGGRAPLTVAGAAFAGSCLVLEQAPAAPPVAFLIAAYAVFGAGYGAVNAVIADAAVAGMPCARAGVAGAMTSAGRQFGQSLGVSLAGAILAVGLHGSLAAGFAAASRPAWLVMAALGFVVLLLSLLTTSRRALRTAELVGASEAHRAREPVGPGGRGRHAAIR
jgi:MFS family permease